MLFVVATQENRQADYTRRTENNLPSNQQGVFLPPPPVPFWYPEDSWGYYPAVQYSAPFSEPIGEANKRSFPPYAYPDGNVYVGYEPFYPLYDQNLADLARVKVTRRESPSSGDQEGHGLVYPEWDRNGHHQRSYMNTSARDDHNRLSAVDSSFAQMNKHLVKSNLAGNEPGDTVLPEEINHLDVQSTTYGPKYHQRGGGIGESGDGDRNGIVTAMNIIDEESGLPESQENTAASSSSANAEPVLGKAFGLHINVPNYTYVDTSDSSDSSDDSSNDDSSSSDSTSDNEQLSDSRRKASSRRDDTTSSNNSSTSDSDSDSYVAYSTNLNSREKIDREAQKHDSAGFPEDNRADFAIATTSECLTSAENRDLPVNDLENADKSRFRKDRLQYSNDFSPQGAFEQDTTTTAGYSEDHSSGRGQSENFVDSSTDKTSSSDCESDEKQTTIDDVASCQVSVIDDMDRQDSKSPCCEDRGNVDRQEEAVFEVTDDPPDDSEPTMVSVSLPLRFKFFVSENNEDVTTVIVGDSKIRTERPCDMKSGCSVGNNEMNDDVSVNFHVGNFHVSNDTNVNFTIKSYASTDDARKVTRGEAEDDEADSSIETTIPQVNFTLKKDSSRTYESSSEEHIEAESRVKTIKPDNRSSTGLMSSADDDYVIPESVTLVRDSLKDEKHVDIVDFACDSLNPRILAESESSLMRDDLETPRVQVIDTSSNSEENRNSDRITCDKGEDSYIDSEVNQTMSEMKRLLNVQDSRDDTDEDEDSGVTSDLSRMISEVDTDSECASSKNSKKYQRTQTHSRLFRLLNDDSIQESSDCKLDASSRKEYLSLPLNTNTAFNYDDSYCSNYSSGLTSPEYSPIHEQSWRRFHDVSLNGSQNTTRNTDHTASQSEQVVPSPHKDDSYFRTWKNSRPTSLHDGHDVVPSLAYKILDSRMPSWAYKVNVLCPRIKSTKSVPRTLTGARSSQTASSSQRSGKLNDPPPTVPPIPSTSCANANANY